MKYSAAYAIKESERILKIEIDAGIDSRFKSLPTPKMLIKNRGLGKLLGSIDNRINYRQSILTATEKSNEKIQQAAELIEKSERYGIFLFEVIEFLEKGVEPKDIFDTDIFFTAKCIRDARQSGAVDGSIVRTLITDLMGEIKRAAVDIDFAQDLVKKWTEASQLAISRNTVAHLNLVKESQSQVSAEAVEDLEKLLVFSSQEVEIRVKKYRADWFVQKGITPPRKTKKSTLLRRVES